MIKLNTDDASVTSRSPGLKICFLLMGCIRYPFRGQCIQATHRIGSAAGRCRGAFLPSSFRFVFDLSRSWQYQAQHADDCHEDAGSE